MSNNIRRKADMLNVVDFNFFKHSKFVLIGRIDKLNLRAQLMSSVKTSDKNIIIVKSRIIPATINLLYSNVLVGTIVLINGFCSFEEIVRFTESSLNVIPNFILFDNGFKIISFGLVQNLTKNFLDYKMCHFTNRLYLIYLRVLFLRSFLFLFFIVSSAKNKNGNL